MHRILKPGLSLLQGLPLQQDQGHNQTIIMSQQALAGGKVC